MSEVNNITLAEVQRAAEAYCCDLVLADDFTLLLDFDGSSTPPDLRHKLYVLERQFMFTVVDTEAWISRSGQGCHVRITMSKPFEFSTRLIFQMFLDSDPLRELLALWRSTLPDGLKQSALFKPKVMCKMFNDIVKESEKETSGQEAQSSMEQIEDMAMLLRRCLRHIPEHKSVYAQIVDYLKRKGLSGTCLREEDSADAS